VTTLAESPHLPAQPFGPKIRVMASIAASARAGISGLAPEVRSALELYFAYLSVVFGGGTQVVPF